MRRKFMLVGLLLTVFVFPYILNIEESSAEGLGCPNSLGIGAQKRCLESKLREQNVKVRILEKSIAESGKARVVLSSQLNDCRMDSPTTNMEPRSSNAIPVFWGKPAQNTDCKSQWNKSNNKAKILANVENATNMITTLTSHYSDPEYGYALDNIAAIARCAKAYPSGC